MKLWRGFVVGEIGCHQACRPRVGLLLALLQSWVYLPFSKIPLPSSDPNLFKFGDELSGRSSLDSEENEGLDRELFIKEKTSSIVLEVTQIHNHTFE